MKQIQAGNLSVSVSYGEDRLNELIDFASRENQKRGFLFVSKVLGKHIPVSPIVMRSIYNELAGLCKLVANTYVIGMSETATGLGAGVADSLSRNNPSKDVFYQHTTRHKLDQPIWLTLNESHSHAVDHILYQPELSVLNEIYSSTQLILVDDEMTTGRTLLQLASSVIKKIPSIKEVIIVTLVSWLKNNASQHYSSLGVPVKFIQLLKGEFAFEADKNFTVKLPENVDDGLCYKKSRIDLGRIGIKMPYRLSVDELEKGNEPVVIVGTGEHLYYPFLIAEALAKTTDVLFQSTTRSPILQGNAIQRKISFYTGNGKTNYIYNLPLDRKITVICESEDCPEEAGIRKNSQQQDSRCVSV